MGIKIGKNNRDEMISAVILKQQVRHQANQSKIINKTKKSEIHS